MMDNNSMETESPEMTPIDGIISRVDSYISNPSQVTPETLNELKNELVDLKTFLDGGEESPEPAPASPEMPMSEAIGR